MKKSILLITMLVASTSVFSASLESLNKEQFIKAFFDKTSVSIRSDDFNGQLSSNTFTMYLDDKGNVWGKLSGKLKSDPQTDTGIYSLDKNGDCYVTWKHWYAGKKLCFRIFNTKNAYLSLECNNVFHTAYMKSNIQAGNHL